MKHKKQFSLESAFFLTLFFSVSGSLAVTAVEFRSYKNKILRLKAMDTGLYDTGLVFWSLFVKTLMVLIPLLSIVVFFFLVRKHRLSLSVLFIGSLSIFSWLVADIRLMRFTGGHLSQYMENVLNVAAWQWGSDLNRLYWQMSWDLILTFLLTTGLFISTYFSIKYVYARFHRKTQKRILRISGILTASIMVGVIPAIQFVDNPLVLERLYGSMPTNVIFMYPEYVPRGGEAAFTVNCDEQYRDLGKILFEASKEAKPIDTEVKIPAKNRPNVILIIVESFRHHAVSPETMPQLSEWAKQGTFLKQHYANSNRSELGTFALLTGRYPFVYDADTNAYIDPQMNSIFTRSGYQNCLVASCIFDYAKMDHFINDKYYDVIIENLHKTKEPGWWKNDRKTISDLKRILKEENDQPKFITSYLMSTHYRYFYPPEYEIYHSNMVDYVEDEHGSVRNSIDRADLVARYKNSLAFMDDLLADLLKEIDLKKNIVVITGDHGESFYEDGYVTHGTMLSEIQTRVPMLMAGPGIPAREFTLPTSHVDLLPTLVNLFHEDPISIKNCHGQDIFNPDYHPMSLLVHEYLESYDLLFAHPEGRLKMNLRRNKPVLRLTGFTNDKGRVDLTKAHSPDEIPNWHKRVDTEIQSLKPVNPLTKTALKKIKPTQVK